MKRVHEERLIAHLENWIRLSVKDRDALPGSVVKLLKLARRILLRRRP
jgi:hypothetical protein